MDANSTTQIKVLVRVEVVMVNIGKPAILGALLAKGERDNGEMTDHHRADRHSMFRLKQIGALLSYGRLGTNRQVPVTP